MIIELKLNSLLSHFLPTFIGKKLINLYNIINTYKEIPN